MMSPSIRPMHTPLRGSSSAFDWDVGATQSPTVLRLVSGLAACALLAVELAIQRHGAACCGFLVACSTGPMANSHGWVICAATAASTGLLLRYDTGFILVFRRGIGLRHSSLGEYAVSLGVLTCCSMLLVMWTSELFERLSAPGVKAFGFKEVQRFHPDDALFLLAPFTWLGWLVPILVAASVCTPIFAVAITVRYFLLKRRGGAA